MSRARHACFFLRLRGLPSALLVCLFFWPYWAQSQSSGAVPRYQAEVVASYPHDPEAFTQGLLIHEGELFESTGQHGASSLRRVDLESGEVLQRVNIDARYFGEGITLLDDRIYFLTWRSNVVFVYDRDSFSLVDSFYLGGEGWGLTDDGEHLIVSDGTAQIRYLDPETGKVLRRLDVSFQGQPLTQLNELEYIRGEIWSNVWYQDALVRIDPESGRVNSIVDLRGLYPERRSQEAVLNGIAWDQAEDRLFVTGKLWSRLFEIRVLEDAQSEE